MAAYPPRPMPMKRKPPVAQAGGYAAEVDTTGMDPEMKKTLGTTTPPKKRGAWEAVMSLFKIK